MIFDLELLSIVAPALAASLLVVAIHVPLGLEVLRRGIIFIDLATAQIAGLGAVAATLYLGHPEGLAGTAFVSLSAFGAALLSAMFFNWVEKTLPDLEEALIGCTFVLAASMALLVLANHPQGDEEIRDLLAGQILWVDWTRIGLMAAIYIPLLMAWFRFRERLGSFGFYIVFAIAVTVSVQVVGVYLVFASLIFPALGARLQPPGKKLPTAYGLAVAGIILGLVTSVLTDYPTGPTLVWSLAVVALGGALVLSRRRSVSSSAG